MKRAVGLLRKLKKAPWYEWVSMLRKVDPVVVEESDESERWKETGCDDGVSEVWSRD